MSIFPIATKHCTLNFLLFNPPVTEASSTSDASTNTNNDLGTSHSTTIPFASLTEVVTTDT